MPLESIQASSFIKGVNASSSKTNQPPQTVARISNMVLTRRGSLITCDGSKILHSFNGVPTAGRGRVMASKLFSPTGVSRYYLSIIKALDQPLGPPQNLTVATAAGGNLAAATYYYKITALDGAGGETTASAEANIVTGANGKNTLNWNIVPNAQSYNVYRSTAPGAELLLLGSATAPLPAPQPPISNTTVSFVDDGTTVIASTVYNLLASPNGAATQPAAHGQEYFIFTATANIMGIQTNAPFTVAGVNPGSFNGNYTSLWIVGNKISSTPIPGASLVTGGGGTLTFNISPPVADTTQQTALYKMPLIVGSPASLPVPYNNSNIVALFPADLLSLDGGGGGGSGGGGGTGGGGTTGGPNSGTASGGIPGNVSFIPEMVQFSNRMVLALGNGFPGQLYSDPTTLTNPATSSPISAIAVDAFGVVTVTVPVSHGIPAAGDGANVLLSGITPAVYNGTFVAYKRISTTQYLVRNLAAIGSGPGTIFGTSLTTTIPIISTFTTAYPTWSNGVTYLAGDIVIPNPANGHYYKCVQAGISAAGQPAFPTITGAQVPEATPSKVIWQEAGLTNSTAPPPQGMAHAKVFAGSLWAWNTAPTNTSNGLDGPTSLRMSDSNNPNSWNPVNQAFLDKDDGSEGSGLSPFTISGFGIPPEGSLVAFKQFAGYQIVGVFGSPNFLIQRIKSNLGNVAPRTLQFTTGYGLTRFTHLGFAVFDGMNDRIIDEDIRPYIFPSNNIEVSDITSVDYNWVAVSWAAQTAYPPMYVAAMPIGSSNGKLTRIFAYDLVLKAWIIEDLPFPIGSMSQEFSTTATPVTILGTFSDGCIHRWQAGDGLWDQYLNSSNILVPPSQVAWSVECPLVQNQKHQGARIYVRQIVVRGQLTDPTGTVNVSIELQGEAVVAFDSLQINYGVDGTYSLNTPVNQKVTNYSPIISGTGAVEVSNVDNQVSMEDPIIPGRLT